MFLSDYKLLFKQVSLTVIFIFIYRVLFYFFNTELYISSSTIEIVKALLYGIRFDIATAFIINLIFILFSIVPVRNSFYLALLKKIFILFNFFFIGFLVVDLEFFSFFGKKLTFDVFEIGGDIQNQAPQLIKNYWYFVLMIFGNIYIFSKLYPRKREIIKFNTELKLYKVILLNIIVLIITAIGIRGGVQLRSLSPKNAFVFEKYELGNLSLNAVYTLVRSIGKKGLKEVSYFKADSLAKEFLLKQKGHKTAEYEKEFKLKNANVVLIIVESLSQEYIEKGYAPFIEQLTKKSLYFSNNYANGRRSIEVLPSIMASFPSLVGKPLYQSQYQTNKFYSLPQALKKEGYITSFFHGGKRGTMDFDAYCSSIGFDEYHAMEDYPDKGHFDGQWGIYDNYFLDYFIDKLNQYKKPFFSSIFTLSSHQPYSIPSEFQNKYPKGNLEIHESIGYIDDSLREFFEKIKKTNWYENTLFIITADHTQKLESSKFNSLLGKYRVPLIFFHPKIELNKKSTRVISQHADIMPSTLDILGVKEERMLHFGDSVFSNNTGVMINRVGSDFILLKSRNLIRFNLQDAKQYEVGEDYLELKSKKVDLNFLKEIKAYIQYTHNGLIKNNIYD